MKINIYYSKVKFRLKEANKIKAYIEKVINEENISEGDLKFIFVSDETILLMNKRFLNHDYYTDVLTFDMENVRFLNAEIYISVDTVKRNAVKYNVTIREEILRVMIHGVLHLCGYNDSTKYEKQGMKKMEDRLLKGYLIS